MNINNDNLEKEEEICTSIQLKKEEKKKIQSLNDLPMVCLVDILSFAGSELSILTYREISKKFNEAVQIRLFMVTIIIKSYFFF